jgi:putative exporter of polyketide antibiotics
MIGAGANCLPIALLFLGDGPLAFPIVPRLTTAVSYGLVLVAFAWELFRLAARAAGWTVELSPFRRSPSSPPSRSRRLQRA